jgi:uncharacterized membrane protein (UPF0182 family)
MPQLRLVVLALQDQLGYGPTFEAAMSNLLGGGEASAGQAGGTGTWEMGGAAGQAPPAGQPAAAPAVGLPPGTVVLPAVQALIEQATRDLADYQRLTAEGKLGEAGQRLESLKKTLDQLKLKKQN